MKDPDDVKFMIKVIELGIIPLCKTASEFKEYMQSLSPDERRRAKRKFRKLWRKIQKEDALAAEANRKKNILHMYPDTDKKSGKISLTTKRYRRHRVFSAIKQDIQKK